MKLKQFILLIAILVTLSACADKTDRELPDPTEAFSEILGEEIVLSEQTEIKTDYADIKSAYLTENEQYLFLAEPEGYSGVISLAIVIDGKSDKTVGMRIISHTETEHYVRDMESAWFVDRFADKSVDNDLVSVHLEAENDNEIVIITGATMTTDGIINGVNSVMSAYKDYKNK